LGKEIYSGGRGHGRARTRRRLIGGVFDAEEGSQKTSLSKYLRRWTWKHSGTECRRSLIFTMAQEIGPLKSHVLTSKLVGCIILWEK